MKMKTLLLSAVVMLATAMLTACEDMPTDVAPNLGENSAEVRIKDKHHNKKDKHHNKKGKHHNKKDKHHNKKGKALLGQAIFADENLSLNRNQSCQSCHTPEWGWTAPNPENSPVGPTEGSIKGDNRFGGRKAMSAAYASPAPALHTFERGAPGAPLQFRGGNFWDGRATGLRDVLSGREPLTPVAEQSQRPFTNPVEMALRDEACVVYRVSISEYAKDYTKQFGHQIEKIEFPADIEELCAVEGDRLNLSDQVRRDIDDEFYNIAIAIGMMFEDSELVNQFSSKYDAWRAGVETLTDQELLGMQLFATSKFDPGAAGGRNPEPAGSCVNCHADPTDLSTPFLGTDWEFDNIGTPENPMNIHQSGPDLGLGGVIAELEAEFGFGAAPPAFYNGQFRVPTVRNIAVQPEDPLEPKLYMHNGVFTTLEEIVHFYNTARAGEAGSVMTADAVDCSLVTYPDATGPNCWPDADPLIPPGRVPAALVGDLELTDSEEAAIVAFLKTLSDGYWDGN